MSVTDRLHSARRWLNYAREDVEAARSFQIEEFGVPRQICFLSQQAAEKAIKAALVFLDLSFPRTHDLTLLMALVPGDWPILLDANTLDQLSEWAIESRYPGDWPDATDADARAALEIADEVFTKISAELRRRGV